MVITFYRTSDNPRKVTKTLSAALGTASGHLHERVSDIQLNIKIPSTMLSTVQSSNYALIDTFSKYYYLRSFDIENDCIILHLYLDVLMSYRTQIRAQTMTVSRNEELSNAYLYDNGYQLLAYKNIVTKEFPNGLNNDTIVLMTIG